MEVLEADRPPGVLERRVAPLLRRRGVQVGLAVLVLGAGGWAVASPDRDEPAEPVAQPPGQDDLAPDRPAAAAGGRDYRGPEGAGPWRIRDDISIEITEAGRTVTFVAVNAGFVARNPRDLQVETSYPGGVASSYAFGCVGGERTANGFRPRSGLVDPGDKVLVQCPDTVRLNGAPARLPPEVIDVVVRPRAADDETSRG